MWPFPVSSPWTAVVTPRLLPLLLTPPPHPPRSPPTPAPLPNWERLFTWALSHDCKHTDIPLVSSVLEASSSSVLTPKLYPKSSTCQRAEPLIVACLSCLEVVGLSMELYSTAEMISPLLIMHIMNVRMVMIGSTNFLGVSEWGQIAFHLSSTTSFSPSRLMEFWRMQTCSNWDCSALHFQPCSLKKTAS